MSLITGANEVCEGYVFTPVCQSFCSWGEVSASVYAGIHTPPGAYTPSGSRHPPGADTTLRSAYWEIRATSGRYASNLNAYLFHTVFRRHDKY